MTSVVRSKVSVNTHNSPVDDTSRYLMHHRIPGAIWGHLAAEVLNENSFPGRLGELPRRKILQIKDEDM